MSLLASPICSSHAHASLPASPICPSLENENRTSAISLYYFSHPEERRDDRLQFLSIEGFIFRHADHISGANGRFVQSRVCQIFGDESEIDYNDGSIDWGRDMEEEGRGCRKFETNNDGRRIR
ncbi:hypothetical protein QVD17_19050 [Tagetes erecta]|uniref:Uncharacterized protein n=1 Tax=Tagetes erecta TaxID=13708 RepID=A0AAD8KIS4_TARER|nr:hypothetical protein QVD17_19050 [Tagetes erecta]